MLPKLIELDGLRVLPLAIQAAGGVLLSLAVLQALVALASGAGLARTRLTVAEGVVSALAWMLPATILRSLVLQDRSQILAFALVLGLRLLVKKTLAWEISRLTDTSRKLEISSISRAGPG